MKRLLLSLIFTLTPICFAENINPVASICPDNSESTFCSQINGDHKVQILNTAVESLRARIDLIRSAKNEIDLEYFIFNQDHVGKILLNEIILQKKQNPNLKVKILLDHFGSKASWKNKEQIKYLIENGFEIRFYNSGTFLLHPKKYNRRDHRKLFIVDSNYIIMGGRNIADDYFDIESNGYIDRDILIQGEIALKAKESIDCFWNLDITEAIIDQNEFDKIVSSPLILDALDLKIIEQFLKISAVTPMAPIRIASNVIFVSDGSRLTPDLRNTKDILNKVLSASKTEVIIENYLFIPEKQRQSILPELIEKNVNIEIITNGIAGGELEAFFLSHLKARTAVKQGATVYEYEAEPLSNQVSLNPEQPLDSAKWKIHTKNFVIDEEISIIGSHNYDPRSAFVNAEDFVVIYGQKEIAKDILNDIELRKENSKKLCSKTRYCDGSKTFSDINRLARVQLKALFPFLKIFENQF